MAPSAAPCPLTVIKPQAINGTPPVVAADGLVYNFSFGSNMCAETLVTRSTAGALSPSWSERAYLPNWHLAFDLIGAPPTEPLMASIVPCRAGGGGGGGCALAAGSVAPAAGAANAAATAAAVDAATEASCGTPPPPAPPPAAVGHAVHGVLLAFQPAAFARLVQSEGGALAYNRHWLWVHRYAHPHAAVRAVVFVTLPHLRAGVWPGAGFLRPSARYRSLVLRGVAGATLEHSYGVAVAASSVAAPAEGFGVRLMAAFFFICFFWLYRRPMALPQRAFRAVSVPAYIVRERTREWAAAGKGRGGVGATAAACCTGVMLAAMAPFAVVGLAMVVWKDGWRGVVVKARTAMNVQMPMGAI